jgi:glutamate-1-semialdehyde 2,1-aminomutase
MTSRLPRPAVVPDLMTVGKYLAGGMSFGAFGGRAELMALYDPARPGALFHAGTFNNNVVSLSAGIAGLRDVLSGEALDGLNARGERLREALNRAGDGLLHSSGRGSLMTIHPGPRAYNACEPPDRRRELVKRLVFLELLDAGQWVAARGMLALSLPITDELCDQFAAALAAIVARHRELLA